MHLKYNRKKLKNQVIIKKKVENNAKRPKNPMPRVARIRQIGEAVRALKDPNYGVFELP